MSDRKLSELKAKKRKFGFKLDYVGVDNYIFLGNLMAFLKNVPEDEYLAELTGMHATDFRLYTDIEELADRIRKHFCN